MKIVKNIGIALLMLCLALSLCACGGETVEPASEAEPEAPVVEEVTKAAPEQEEAALPEGMVAYKVTVVDEGGNPIASAMVQLCKDSCVPAVTDANGVASFTLAEDDYKAQMLTMPEGYEYAGEEDTFYFEDGSHELTIVLKAVA